MTPRYIGFKILLILIFMCPCIITFIFLFLTDENIENKYNAKPYNYFRWVAVMAPGTRLANQLFVLASSHGIAEKRNARWCIIGFYGTPYESYLEWTSEPPEECPRWYYPFSLEFSQAFFEMMYEGKEYATYNDKYIKTKSQNILLVGYFQSFKYFQNVSNPIPFKLKEADHAQLWVESKHLSAAIHIRRGDNVNSNFYVTPSLVYYHLAISKLKHLFQLKSREFVVVTDDPSWVRKQGLFNNMEVLNSNNPSFDMAVISACKHKIISTGTFGWWGAMLNDTGMVIYPTLQRQNDGVKGFINEDFFPPHWAEIDYTNIFKK